MQDHKSIIHVIRASKIRVPVQWTNVLAFAKAEMHCG